MNWEEIRSNIIGQDLTYKNKHGKHKVIYADWIASGRLYKPIEEYLMEEIGPLVSNPHSYSSHIGSKITNHYQEARDHIKKHVNASEDDILVATGSGMTDAIIRLQSILGLFHHHKERPVIFITHMEHHSNHTLWMACEVDVVILTPDPNGLVSLETLEDELKKVESNRLKIGAFSACSNVTGIINPIHEMAEIMHKYDGYCFADYAASAPYVSIDMHPPKKNQQLDAIYFSPHKFLGGPGSSGVLVFHKSLHNGVARFPSGGNVRWTNPEGAYGVSNDLETLEDGGTPPFLQTIKASLAIGLKEQIGIEEIKHREESLLSIALKELGRIEGISILEQNYKGQRLGVLSFNLESLHYNLVVRLLSDRFGVQVRGGWSCASTYAHYLFDIERTRSSEITNSIEKYDASLKPGWVRISLHPTLSNEELQYSIDAIHRISIHGLEWAKDYTYNEKTNEFDVIQN